MCRFIVRYTTNACPSGIKLDALAGVETRHVQKTLKETDMFGGSEAVVEADSKEEVPAALNQFYATHRPGIHVVNIVSCRKISTSSVTIISKE